MYTGARHAPNERIEARTSQGFEAKSGRERAEKQAIALQAASYIAPGSAIGITAGTTTYQLVPHICSLANLTVVTNSLPIAAALNSVMSPDLQIVITGGSPTRSNAIVGPLAERSLAGLHLDQVFMGVHGMGETSGYTTPNLAEAQTNQAFIRSGRRVVALADATKWGVTGLGTIAMLSDADAIISDTNLPVEARGILQREVGRVDIVTTA